MKKIYNRDLVNSDLILKRKKSWRYCLALLFGMFLSIASFGQTTIINPATDGAFEGASFAADGWTVLNNATAGASWVQSTGATAGFTGTKCAYISSNVAGSPPPHSYTISGTRVSALYRDVTVPAGESTISLSFKWICVGESGYDRLQVWAVPTSFTPLNGTASMTTTGTAPTGRVQLGEGATGYKSSGAWTTANIVVPAAYAGTTFRLVFQWRNDSSGGSNPPIAVDDVSLISACTGAVAIAANTITSTTATANWNAFVGATSYDLRYRVVGSGSWTTLSSLAGTSASLNSLSSASNYEYQVKANGAVCNTFSNSINFTTLCEAITSFPWTENFESATAPNLPICWSANDANDDGGEWITYSTYGVGASIAAGLYTDYNEGDNNDFLILPRMTLTGNQRLKFFVRAMSTGEPNDYRVVLSTTGNQPADFTNELMSLTEVSSTTMTEIAPIDLSAYSGDVFIAVHVPAGGLDGYYLYVDNFTIEDIPSCLAPTVLASSNIATTTAILSWTASASSPSNGYDIYYSTTNTAPLVGTTPTVNNHTASPLNATGLTSASTYYWWVRSDCGAETSAWASGGSFTTLCEALIAPTAVENFETFNGAAPSPVCWSEATGTLALNATLSGTTSGWTLKTSGFANASAANKGFSINLYSTKNEWMISPAIDLGSTAGIYRLKYRYAVTSYDGTATVSTLGTHKVDVVISTDGGTTWSNANSLKTYTGAASYSNTGAFETINLTAYSGVVKIAFVASTTSTTPDIDFHVDDFSVESLPNCLEPTALTSSNIAATTATLNWTASTSSPTNGYDIYYSTTNTAPLAGTTPTVNNHTASPLNATSLTPASTYYWWVRSDCDSETSAWAYGGSFTTLCVAFTIPYSENFDTTATGSSAVPSAPTCWSYLETAAGAGSGYTYSFSTPNTTPNHFYLTNSSDNSGSYMLVSPNTTDLSDGSNRVRFYAKAGGSAGYVLALGTLSDPLDVNSFTSIQAITLTATYAEYTVNLPAGTDSYLAFKHGLGGTYRSVYIDNVMVENMPSCLEPTSLMSSNVTTSSADLSWTSAGSDFDIKYGATGFNVATEGTLVENFTNGGTLSSLTTGTNYQYYVRQDCGNGDLSAWAGPYSFRIPNIGESCSAPIAVTALPYTTTDDTANYSDNPAYEGSPGASGCGSTSSYLNGNDVVYAYTSTFTGAIKIDLTPTATYSGIFAYASCADIGVNCIGGVANDGTTLRTFNLNVQNGTTYYLVISTWATPQTTAYTLNISKVCPAGVWVGTTSNFNTASNWADNMVPEACTAVTVNVAAPMTISSDVTVASITLGASANVTVNGILNVGNISVANGGIFTVANNAVLLQTPTAVNTGVATVKVNSANLYRQDYTLWASPVAGQNLRNFSAQTLFNRFSSYDAALGTNGDYVQEIVTTADMNTKTFAEAKGYLIRMPNNWTEYVNLSIPGTPYLGQFTGTLNNGGKSIALSLANSKLNLVGNPYPSPISISAFFAANPNINELIYFWRKRNDASGSGFATYNSMGLVSTHTDVSGTFMNNTIKPGQGFFVQSNTATTLNFTNDMRTSTQGTPFLRSTNEMHRFWLNLSNATDTVGQTLVGYATGATLGVDNGLDALYFNDSPLALTSLIDNVEYIIQGRSLPFVDSDVVPLGFKSDVAGNFTISLSSFDGLFADDQAIYLKDNTAGTLHNLKVSAYTFTTPIGVFNDRFEVQYTNSTLGTTKPGLATNTILVGVKDQVITINSGVMVMEKIELIDVAGRVIYTQNGVNGTSATLENVVSSNQMLIVRISTSENGVVTQKIIF